MDNFNRRRSLKEILPKKDKGAPSTTGNMTQQIAVDRANSQDTSPAGTNKKEFMGNRRGKLNTKMVAGIVIVIVVILGIIIFSTTFAQATISIIPKQVEVNLDNRSFTAERNSSGSNLEFGLVSNDITATEKVEATGVETIERKASGTITIFNEFSEQPEKLITQTRFESPDGKIYRIDKPVTVPGYTTEGGQTIPGTIDVEVFADEEGESYNIGLVDFTVPGLSGDPRFDKVYAKSKTPMTGGMIGEVKTVSSADEEAARTKLRAELEDRQSDLNQPQIPDGFILFDDAIFYTYSEAGIESEGEGVSENEAVVVEKLSFNGILFNKAELSQFLANRFIPDYDGEPVMIANFDELEFSLVNKDEITDPNNLSELEFTLNGSPRIVWEVDEITLKNDIKGLKKEAVTQIIGSYSSIARSNQSFRPFWISTVPNNDEKIKIEYQIVQN